MEQEKIKPTETQGDDQPTKKTEESEIDENAQKNGTENLVVSRIELTPKYFNLPSYFYIEIENKGTRTIENLEILVDLGKAKYEEFDFTKSVDIKSIIDCNDRSFLKFEVPIIKQHQTIEIYSLQSLPVFKSVSMNASNMTFDKLYSYGEFLISEGNGPIESSGFETFLIVMLSLVIIVFTIYFVIVGITYLKKLFKIE